MTLSSCLSQPGAEFSCNGLILSTMYSWSAFRGEEAVACCTVYARRLSLEYSEEFLSQFGGMRRCFVSCYGFATTTFKKECRTFCRHTCRSSTTHPFVCVLVFRWCRRALTRYPPPRTRVEEDSDVTSSIASLKIRCAIRGRCFLPVSICVCGFVSAGLPRFCSPSTLKYSCLLHRRHDRQLVLGIERGHRRQNQVSQSVVRVVSVGVLRYRVDCFMHTTHEPRRKSRERKSATKGSCSKPKPKCSASCWGGHKD